MSLHTIVYNHIKEAVMSMPDDKPITQFMGFYQTKGVTMNGLTAGKLKGLIERVEDYIVKCLRDNISLPDIIVESHEILRGLSRLPSLNNRQNVQWMINVIVLVKTGGMPYNDGHGLVLMYEINGRLMIYQ